MEKVQKISTLIIGLAVFCILIRINKLWAFIFLALCFMLFVYNKRAKFYSVKGQIAFGKGNLDEGIKWFQKAYNSKSCSIKEKVSYGYLLLRKGNLEEAEEVLQKCKNEAKGDDELLLKQNLSLVLWKKGNLDGALELLQGVYENYKNTTVYGSLGYFKILKGDVEEAIKFNEEAYDYNSEDSIIMDNLGQAYYLGKEYDKAEEIYNKLMKKEPGFPEAYYNFGLVLLAKGNKEEALNYMKKALTFKISFISTLDKSEVENKIREIEEV